MQRQRSLSLDFGAWPAADREAWRSAVAPATRLFDLGGAESRLRPATLKLYVDTYGHWLGFLERTEKAVPAGSAASRVTESRLDAWVGEQRQRGNRNATIHGRLRGLYGTLRVLEPTASIGFILRPGGISLNRAIPQRRAALRRATPWNCWI